MYERFIIQKVTFILTVLLDIIYYLTSYQICTTIENVQSGKCVKVSSSQSRSHSMVSCDSAGEWTYNPSTRQFKGYLHT